MMFCIVTHKFLSEGWVVENVPHSDHLAGYGPKAKGVANTNEPSTHLGNYNYVKPLLQPLLLRV